jgi:CBS domain-containing protein
METIELLLEHKGHTTHSVAPTKTVLEAVVSMCSAHIGALVVNEGERPIGIFTERDVMTRLILAKRDPAKTLVGDVMTRRVVCVDDSRTIDEAMAIMNSRQCRHLPVMHAGRARGVVSIGDLVRRLVDAKEAELHLLEDYIVGRYPG